MLSGHTIAVTAERRAHQQVDYFESRGATVRWVPVIRTESAEEKSALATSTAAVIAAGIDLLIVQTGQGLNWWLDTVSSNQLDDLNGMLANCEVIARGSKAASSARRRNLNVVWQAPNESVSDVAQHLATMTLAGMRVVVLLDGNDDHRVVEAARHGGAAVTELHVYRYEMPDDLDDVIDLIDDIVEGRIDVVTFTASPAIRHLRTIAQDAGRLNELDEAFRSSCRAAVVGPVCASTARSASWTNIVEPPTARLVPMLDATVAALVSTG
jgi:uroporphyrinogen-III synthase